MKHSTLIPLLAFVGLPFIIYSQEHLVEVDAPKNQLSYMVGEWHGEGWQMSRSGRETSMIKEIVECKLDCNLIVVSGLGTKTDPTTGVVTVVHEAFGVITYDHNSGKHMIRAYKGNDVIEAELVLLEEKVFQWSIPAPGGGTVRFTVDFTQPDVWKEKGEYSRDGVTWMPSMEMELRKVE
jgi:hypothetical protein